MRGLGTRPHGLLHAGTKLPALEAKVPASHVPLDQVRPCRVPTGTNSCGLWVPRVPLGTRVPPGPHPDGRSLFLTVVVAVCIIAILAMWVRSRD